MSTFYRNINIGILALALSACATTPQVKNIDLPKSTITTPSQSVDGSAIAFQASVGRCFDTSFEVSPRLSDGKYGESQKLEFTINTLKFPTKGLNQTKFAHSKNHLYVKTMPPGNYVITRIKCRDSQSLKNGTQYNHYFTNPERIDIFGEFDVEAGKTNYLGGIEISYAGQAPVLRVADKSERAEPFFDKHYADKVAPFHVKLIQTDKTFTRGAELEALRELLGNRP